MMKNLTCLLVFSALVLLGSTAHAQDSSELVSALTKAKATTVNGTASISEEKSQPDGAFGGAMAMVVGMGDQGGPTAFQGDVEVFAKDGVIAAASVGELPQIKVYKQGQKQLFSQIHGGNAVDTSAVAALLSRVLDMDSLIAEVKRAKRVRVKNGKGIKMYRVTLDGDYFDEDPADAEGDHAAPMAMAMGSMMESAIEGVLSVGVDSDGNLKGMKLDVQYNNPMADIIGQAMKGGGAGGAMQLQLGAGGGEKSTTPGKKVTLTFKVKNEESKAAMTFADEAAKMLE